jgi:hypothetical protein
MQRCDLRNLNDGKVRGKVNVSNRFTALENLYDNADIDRVWENIGENIKISVKESLFHYKLKQHKPWFDNKY